MTRARLARSLVANAFYFATVSLCAFYFTQLRFTLTTGGGATLDSLVSGTAPTPFQYRVLIPWLVKGLQAIVPSLVQHDVFWFIELIATISLALVFRAYLGRLLGPPPLAAMLSLSVFYALPFHFLFPRQYAFFYPSDMPAVLFFTLGLLYLHSQDWKRYYPLLLLATLNRETTIFLIIIYLLTASGTTPPRRLAIHAVAQVAIWGAAKVGLYGLYQHNPGLGIFESQLLSNLMWLSQPDILVEVASMWGFVWVPVLVFARSIPDPFVRRALWAASPFLLGLGAVGVVHEMRIYAELIPLMLGAFWLIVLRLAQGESFTFARSVLDVPPIPAVMTALPAKTPRRPSSAWIGLAVLWLAGALTALYLWSDRQATQSIEPVRASILSSAQTALAAAQPGQRLSVINWPESLRTPLPARVLGLVPFTPSALGLPRPEVLAPTAVFLQYLPWQVAEGNGARLYYTGRIVTESELRQEILQSDRVLDFHASTSQMYTLKERWPSAPASTCRARFGAAGDVCLVMAMASRHGAELRIDLIWRVAPTLASDVTVFVHVLADDGVLISQADGDLVNNLIALSGWPSQDYVLRETRWAQAPPGPTLVRVGLYDRQTGDRWPAACGGVDECSPDGLVLSPTLLFP